MIYMGTAKVRIIFESLGALAVLLGLIFVGIELSQNTAALSSQAILELNRITVERQSSIAQDDTLAELVLEGMQDPNSLSDIDQFQLTNWLLGAFNIYEAAWIYQNNGIIDEDDGAAYSEAICIFLEQKGARWFWDNELGVYVNGFVEHVNSSCIQESN